MTTRKTGPRQEWLAPLGAAKCLSLAAAPTFAAMALLTSVDGGTPDVLCSGGSPLGGMAVMYLLMSAFHAAPWLKLISGWRIGSGLIARAAGPG